jgi:hypothetical protein
MFLRCYHRTPQSDGEEAAAARRQKRSYSDSDNSYDALRSTNDAKKKRTVDWMDLAAQSRSSQLLYVGVNEKRINDLIGWATTYDLLDDQQRENQKLKSQSQSRQNINPLFCLPSAPLPPSHLHFLSNKITRSPEYDKKLLAKSFSESALVATGIFLEEMITASLLPIAGFHVMRCRAQEENSDVVASKAPNCRILTNPITGERRKSDQVFLELSDKTCREWTLPPEEAMLKLLQQGLIPDSGLELSRQPTRSIIFNTKDATASRKTQWDKIVRWSREKGLNPKYVVANMDIYRLFLLSGSLELNPSRYL